MSRWDPGFCVVGCELPCVMIAQHVETLEWVEFDREISCPLYHWLTPCQCITCSPEQLLHHGYFLEKDEINMKLPCSLIRGCGTSLETPCFESGAGGSCSPGQSSGWVLPLELVTHLTSRKLQFPPWKQMLYPLISCGLISSSWLVLHEGVNGHTSSFSLRSFMQDPISFWSPFHSLWYTSGVALFEVKVLIKQNVTLYSLK